MTRSPSVPWRSRCRDRPRGRARSSARRGLRPSSPPRAKGRRVSLSATSSRPSMSPRPRTSPTCGCAARRRRRARAFSPSDPGPLHQALALEDLEGGQARRRGDRVVGEGEAVGEARGTVEGRHDPVAREHRAHRHVAAAHALPAGHEVGPHAAWLDAEPGARASEARHHLVVDVDDAVAGADLPGLSCVLPGRHRSARGGAEHGLGDERGHRLRTLAQDHGLELVGAGDTAVGIGLPEGAVVAEGRGRLGRRRAASADRGPGGWAGPKARGSPACPRGTRSSAGSPCGARPGRWPADRRGPS